jgi:hypothetical protein
VPLNTLDAIMDTLEKNKASSKPDAKPSVGKKPLRPRPVEGEIDYAELTRDTIKKFPKILAALAK